jgi:hypothetical protein
MINGIQGSMGAFPMAGAGGIGGGARPDREKMLSSTADLLHMSVDDLKSKLDAGQSLDDVAKAQGVSHDDLVASIVQNMKANAPAGANVADAQLTAMAERVAARVPHGNHHGGSTPSVDPSTTNSSATFADLMRRSTFNTLA